MPVVTLDARCTSILDLLENDWNVYTSPLKRLAARLRPKKQLPFRVSELRLSQSSCFMSPYDGHNTMLSDYCETSPLCKRQAQNGPNAQRRRYAENASESESTANPTHAQVATISRPRKSSFMIGDPFISFGRGSCKSSKAHSRHPVF